MRHALYSIQRLLRRLQILNRFFEEDFYTGLPALQSLMLIEIDSSPFITATDLCQIFSLEKSIISKALSSLERKKLIRRKQNTKDGRKLIFEITKAGERILELNDKNSNEFVQRQLKSFTSAEIKKFTNYFQKFCDGLSFKNSPKRKHDSDLRVAIRRYTKGVNLVHSTYLSSGLTPSQWFTLEEIYWGEGFGLNPSVMSKKLRIIPSSLNQVLSVLEKNKLIQKQESRTSKREKLIFITQKGSKLFEQVEEETQNLFSQAFNNLSEQEGFEFAALLRKYINEIEPGDVWLDGEIVISEIKTDEEKRASRGFIATQLVNNKRADDLPETVIGSSNASYSLKINGELRSVIELDRKSLAILNFFSLPEVKKEQLDKFVDISKLKTKSCQLF